MEAANGQPAPRRVLDNDYQIRSCQAEPGESPEVNEQEAQVEKDYQVKLSRAE